MQSTFAVVSLKNICANAQAIKDFAGVPLIAVVKDDGYGHGAEQVAHALGEQACAFAVSTVDEGAALRVSGITQEILVLTPPLCKEEVVRAAGYALTLSLSSLAVLHIVGRTGCRVRAHLVVNTGMNRYGIRPELINEACVQAERAGIDVTGVYSHFYLPQDEGARAEQTALFQRACEVARAHFPQCMRHISATGGLLLGETYDCVRAGLSLYGYLPDGFEGRLEVSPAMKLYATVAQSGTALGGGLGYGRAEKKYKKVRTLRLGYGDGLFRTAGGIAEGNLCMDACIQQGSGRTGQRKLILNDVSAYAKAAGTTEYEVLVNMSRKAVKIYV